MVLKVYSNFSFSFVRVCFYLLISFLFSKNVLAVNTTNAKGSSTVYMLGGSEAYTSGDNTVWGFVDYQKGLSIASTTTVRFGVTSSVKDSMSLSDGSCIQLLSDLHFDGAAVISIGSSAGDTSYVIGNSHAMILHGGFELPTGKHLHFLGDTIIDCNGGRFDLKPGAQLIVDSNVTLTLRNLVLEYLEGQASVAGGIMLADNSASLALQNVVVNITGTYVFDIGSLYIHEDVVFTGSSGRFEHTSIYNVPNQKPLRICSNSMLYFDNDTTFVFDHDSGTSNLCRLQLIMTDTSSRLHFNNSTFSVPVNNSTYGGVDLWNGTLILENRVKLENYNVISGLPNTDDSKGIDFGNPPLELNVILEGGARAELFGCLNYQNNG